MGKSWESWESVCDISRQYQWTNRNWAFPSPAPRKARLEVLRATDSHESGRVSPGRRDSQELMLTERFGVPDVCEPLNCYAKCQTSLPLNRFAKRVHSAYILMASLSMAMGCCTHPLPPWSGKCRAWSCEVDNLSPTGVAHGQPTWALTFPSLL